MKILNLETYDFGGSGISRLYFLDECKKRGYDAKLIVLEKRSQRDDVIPVVSNRIILFLTKLYYKIITFLKIGSNANNKYNFFNVNLNLVSAEKILKLYGDVPDVIVISWVTNLVNFRTIKKLQELTKAKILFVMTDNANITGGCHYPFDCVGFQKDCHSCPALNKWNRTAYHTLLHKKKYLPNNCAIIGTGNDCRRAQLSSVFKNVESFVDISTEIYPYEYDKFAVRENFGINMNSFVISFGATNISSERIGFKFLIEALNLLARDIISDNIVILVAGDNCKMDIPSGMNVKLLGRLSTEDLFKMYYASDVFVCPSVEDSGPLMVNQAVSCGTPVVAFNVGVVQDLIVHKTNGYIAEKYNSEQLKNGIVYFYTETPDEHQVKKFNRQLLEGIRTSKTIYSYLEKQNL